MFSNASYCVTLLSSPTHFSLARAKNNRSSFKSRMRKIISCPTTWPDISTRSTARVFTKKVKLLPLAPNSNKAFCVCAAPASLSQSLKSKICFAVLGKPITLCKLPNSRRVSAFKFTPSIMLFWLGQIIINCSSLAITASACANFVESCFA